MSSQTWLSPVFSHMLEWNRSKLYHVKVCADE
jgi:hypothetical protein